MKRSIFTLLVVGFCFSCNNDANVDAHEGELDSLGNQIENYSEQAGDSAKSTINRREDSLDNDKDDTSKY